MKLLYIFETNIPKLDPSKPEAIEEYIEKCRQAIAACFVPQAQFNRFTVTLFDESQWQSSIQQCFKKFSNSNIPPTGHGTA